jgi:hypothetical protein
MLRVILALKTTYGHSHFARGDLGPKSKKWTRKTAVAERERESERPREKPQLTTNGYQQITALLRPRRFLPSQRQKVLRPLDRLGHLPQQLLQIFIPIDEINI